MRIQSEDIQSFYFLGIGGIGMSALARYFHSQGYPVAGYDRTPSALTRELEAEGIGVVYEDDPSRMADEPFGLRNTSTLVVRTPAVPDDCAIYTYLREHDYDIRKRAEVLGIVTHEKRALCVAGTHGKTTTSTMLAHLLADNRGSGVNAFLGGISMNYGTNVLIDPASPYAVVEADEYDRSFHHLRPHISVVTAVDPDHLDIYGTADAYRDSFAHYTSLISDALVMKYGIALQPRLQAGVRLYTYGVSQPLADFYSDNIRVADGTITFDFHTPESAILNIRLGVPVWVNIENATAAMSVAWLVLRYEKGEKTDAIEMRMRERIADFKGVLRRFNIHVNTPRVVYIDDYAHHPEEMATAIDSVRRLFPDRRLIGVFQPHLYTRTRDFADGFRRVLATLDETILLPIYPARELPIPGVTSEMLGGRVVQKADLIGELKKQIAGCSSPVVVLTIGAGDIDRLVPDITENLNLYNNEQCY